MQFRKDHPELNSILVSNVAAGAGADISQTLTRMKINESSITNISVLLGSDQVLESRAPHIKLIGEQLNEMSIVFQRSINALECELINIGRHEVNLIVVLKQLLLKTQMLADIAQQFPDDVMGL